MNNITDTVAPPELKRVTRAVVVHQAIWTAGHSLTTGGFLIYFGKDLGAQGFILALLLAVPETVGVVGILARWVIQRIGNRKRVWFTFSLAARYVSLGIPLLAFPQFRPDGIDPLWVMIGCLAASQAINAISYMAFLSWLSDLVPEYRWGRFFAKRKISQLCILLVVPVSIGFTRDWWKNLVVLEKWSADVALMAYVVAFAVGVALLLASMFPMLRLPNVPVSSASSSLPERRLIAEAFRNRSMRFLLFHNWHLALANGLTQAAFFSYIFGPLAIGLGTFYVLLNVMNAVMIPVSYAAGRWCDFRGNKPVLYWGVLSASCALPFWLLATPGQWWWLFGAYFVWGSFGAVNIAGRNLALKLSPRSDNTAHLALFRLVSGLLAGVSGLLGGVWLKELRDSNFLIELGTYRFEGFQLLFLVSWIGRMTAAFWIVPIREPDVGDVQHSADRASLSGRG